MELYDLHTTDPYAGLEVRPADVRGWDSESPSITQVIEKARPALIIEVGSWLGASAIHMASCCKTLGLDTKIVCVDHWLGSLEMWLYPDDPEHQADALNLKHGYPTLYYTFLSNVVRAGHDDCIITFPTTSHIAAQWFARKDVQADAIYLDASHDDASVTADLHAYWPLVKEGGVLFGDDLPWPSVAAAVSKFAKEINRPLEGNWRHWEVWK